VLERAHDAMETVLCPRCGTEMLTQSIAGRAVHYESRVDPDDPSAEMWVVHTAVRCEFAALITVNFR